MLITYIWCGVLLGGGRVIGSFGRVWLIVDTLSWIHGWLVLGLVSSWGIILLLGFVVSNPHLHIQVNMGVP